MVEVRKAELTENIVDCDGASKTCMVKFIREPVDSYLEECGKLECTAFTTVYVSAEKFAEFERNMLNTFAWFECLKEFDSFTNKDASIGFILACKDKRYKKRAYFVNASGDIFAHFVGIVKI